MMAAMTAAERREFNDFRDEIREEIKSVREDFQPALDFYRLVVGFGEVIRWGVGIASGLVVIAASTKALGWW